jgi:two-component system capsular synthesis sensor histidine kinase RcsC
VRIGLTNYLNNSDQISTLLIISNITEKLELERIKLAESMKTMMISSISHEIRTPLYHIIGTLDLMNNPMENIDMLIKLAKASSQRLLAKVDDILDYSEIEKG